ncbi:MAG: YeeE/YedE family protein [Deinococcales bacterium]
MPDFLQQVVELLQKPLPWYVAGPLIGLTVPLMLLLGNRSFGLSSNLRHACAILLPEVVKPPFLRYNWRAETWNLVFVLGLLIGGFLSGVVFVNPDPVAISEATKQSLERMGVALEAGIVPSIFANPDMRTLGLLALGGFLIGFGTRYAGGCTSGHAITGLSMLQLPSLLATISFFVAGIVSANVILPLVLR